MVHLILWIVIIYSTENLIFHNNLRKIESTLPNILAEFLFNFYTTRGKNSIEEILSLIANTNEFSNIEFIEHNIKEFLCHIALGMVPKTMWAGDSVNGGCIIVSEQGDLYCYTLHDIEDFKDFLFENNKLDTPSSSRHKLGVLYEENGELFFKLNLQIRFI